MSKIDYIIVQAGGKGTRLEFLTKNKPKALVPIDNLPMIFHLFRKFPEKKFIIIGDYKIDVLKKYLATFAEVKYIVVDAQKQKGTCAGIEKAVSNVPDNEAFMLIWSDLVLPKEFVLPDVQTNYLGISKGFSCRWRYKNQSFEEIKSEENGVAGLFIFKNKYEIKDVPKSGEFVKWLQGKNITFETISLYKTKEYGLFQEYEKLQPNRCRPFNKIRSDNEKIIKEGIDQQGKNLAIRECNWYKLVQNLGIKEIPLIYQFTPLVMEKINGKNIFEYSLVKEQRKEILKNIIEMLKKLHSKKSVPVDYYSIWENYYKKTFVRLEKVQNMIPFALNREIVINGRKCKNIFFFKDKIEEFLDAYRIKDFKLIHGDCTFSNLLLREDGTPVMIDPRGYFGYTEIYGDENYDWAKLYYSIVGDYDQFNLKRFKLEITDSDVKLEIQSNGWKDLEEYFFELLNMNRNQRNIIKMLHTIIWLSLTTYAWEDYDSICGAFYNGLLYFEEVSNELF